MSDPAIKLFCKTIQLPEIALTPVDSGSVNPPYSFEARLHDAPSEDRSSSSNSSLEEHNSDRVGGDQEAQKKSLSWGRNYQASMFKNDLMAGLTLASLCIPQSIGYASLAKLDPQYGLWSSREIAIGLVAMVSLLLSAMIQKIVDPMADLVAYRRLVFNVTFFAGSFQALFGIFK